MKIRARRVECELGFRGGGRQLEFKNIEHSASWAGQRFEMTIMFQLSLNDEVRFPPMSDRTVLEQIIVKRPSTIFYLTDP